VCQLVMQSVVVLRARSLQPSAGGGRTDLRGRWAWPVCSRSWPSHPVAITLPPAVSAPILPGQGPSFPSGEDTWIADRRSGFYRGRCWRSHWFHQAGAISVPWCAVVVLQLHHTAQALGGVPFCRSFREKVPWNWRLVLLPRACPLEMTQTAPGLALFQHAAEASPSVLEWCRSRVRAPG